MVRGGYWFGGLKAAAATGNPWVRSRCRDHPLRLFAQVWWNLRVNGGSFTLRTVEQGISLVDSLIQSRAS